MIDDSDDSLWFALFWPSGGGPFMTLLGIGLAICIALAHCSDRAKCEEKQCPAGTEKALIKHECVCLGKATAR